MSLGIIGGMGPMATVYFMELIVKMTKAGRDSEHLEMIVYNAPTIPDRTQFILGKSEESPLPRMLEIEKQLKKQNVTCIAIPCMTAHYFHEELMEMGVPVIHGIRETAETLKESGVTRVGIMATDGTISSGIFQREVEALGMEAVIPEERYQTEIMGMIYEDIKAGKMPELSRFHNIKEYFIKEKGAQAVVLGCTELSLLKKAYDLGDAVIDTLEVLAKEAIECCGMEVNTEYERLCVPFLNDCN